MTNDDEVDIVEMSQGDSDYVEWAGSQNIGINATPGCDCAHNGLGPSWHGNDCPGANAALKAKCRELFNTLATLRERQEREDREFREALMAMQSFDAHEREKQENREPDA
jgi:hypothetical protein